MDIDKTIDLETIILSSGSILVSILKTQFNRIDEIIKRSKEDIDEYFRDYYENNTKLLDKFLEVKYFKATERDYRLLVNEGYSDTKHTSLFALKDLNKALGIKIPISDVAGLNPEGELVMNYYFSSCGEFRCNILFAEKSGMNWIPRSKIISYVDKIGKLDDIIRVNPKPILEMLKLSKQDYRLRLKGIENDIEQQRKEITSILLGDSVSDARKEWVVYRMKKIKLQLHRYKGLSCKHKVAIKLAKECIRLSV